MTNREPTHYAWLRDGDWATGTLFTYARMWEHDYYAGEVSLSNQLLTWNGTNPPVTHTVHVQRYAPDEQDYIAYDFTVNNEQARVMIDGRA